MKRMLLAFLMLPMAAAASPGPTEGIKVTTDRTVDTSSLDTIVQDVFRLAGAKTNDEKAIAIHTWLHHAIFHNAYPVEKSPQSVGPFKGSTSICASMSSMKGMNSSRLSPSL